MAITYPIVLPHQGFASIRMRPRNAVAVQQSPFTFQQQVQANQGQRWEIDVSYPPLRQSGMADDVVAALTSLRGPYGTFLLGNSSRKTARGSLLYSSSEYVGPGVLGGSQTGDTLATTGWSSSNLVINNGDYIQIGGQNLIKRSQDFSHSDWEKASVNTSADSTVSPDGSSTADTISATASDCAIYQIFNTENTGLLTGSVWIKAVSSNVSLNIILRRQSSTLETTFSKTITATSVWQRFTITGTALDRSSHVFQIGGDSSFSSGESVFAWGAQVNAGSEPDGYFPTTSTPTTLKRRLHQVIEPAFTNGSGNVTLSIWPRLRESPPDASRIKLTNCQGTFRLAGDFEWDVDSAKTYGVSFSAVEAI